MDQNIVQMMVKKNLDHSDIDRFYFMRKMENESKIVDQK
jgi:hypothetical protein